MAITKKEEKISKNVDKLKKLNKNTLRNSSKNLGIKEIKHNINDIEILYNNNPFFKKLKILSKKSFENKKLKIFKDNYLIKNESLNINKSNSNFKIINSNSTKTNNSININNYTNTNSSLRHKKFEEKKNILKEKIKEKENKINIIKKIKSISLSNKIKESKSKTEMKLIKIKLKKIFKENINRICNVFDKKNNSFNKKVRILLESEKYIKGKKLEENNFSPNKKDFFSSHNLSDFYYDYDSNTYNNEEFINKVIGNSFSDREKKIISSSPKYFSINNKKSLLKILKINPYETLKEKIQKEENLKNANKTIIKSKINNIKRNNSNFQKKLNYNKFDIFNIHKKIIHKINLNNNYAKEKNKKRIFDFFNKEIRNYYNKYNMMKGKIYNRKENENYYKIYNCPIKYNMTKEYIIDSNNERLNKEDYFHYLRNKNKNYIDNTNNIITKYKEIMKKNYKEV